MDVFTAKSVVFTAMMAANINQPAIQHTAGIDKLYSPYTNVEMLKLQLEQLLPGEDLQVKNSIHPQLQECLRESFDKYSASAAWENDDFYFGYGKNFRDELVVFGWMKDSSKQSLDIKELARIYLDEKLGDLKTQKELEAWRAERTYLMGAFARLRHSEITAVSYKMTSQGKLLFDPQAQVLSLEPSVIQFSKPRAYSKYGFPSSQSASSKSF